MPTFNQTTKQAPTPASDILAGTGHRIVDIETAESQTLALGEVVGVLSATGQAVALDRTQYNTTASGDGSTQAFDLGHDSVDADSVIAMVDGSRVFDFSINRGTGTDGVDRIQFGTAPASGTDNIQVYYMRSSARPAGVMFKAVDNAAGETPTHPVVTDGSVLMDQLTGVPAGYSKGMSLGGLFLE